MRKLSTLLFVALFAVGTISMVGCKKDEAKKDGKDKKTSSVTSPADGDLNKVSFKVTGMR
jgi:hypothetical protein